MNDVFYLKRGDTLPPMRATLLEADGVTPVDLAGATVVLQLRDRRGTHLFDADCTVLDAEAGRVEYEWVEGDTDTVGAHRAEFEITSSDGIATAPNYGFVTVHISEDIREEVS